MKDIIKSIANKYSTDRIQYGLITFHYEASIKLPFNGSSSETLVSLINFLPSETGGPALDKALDAAVILFEGDGVRYDAEKVLVVMVDKRSSGSDVDALKSAMELKEKGVNIITVAVGSEAYPNNLQNITSNPGNVINTTTTEEPEGVGNKIIEKTGSVGLSLTSLLRRSHVWVECIVGSLPRCERFFSRCSSFPLSLKTNTFKFQFDVERTDTFQQVLLQKELLSAQWVKKLLLLL